MALLVARGSCRVLSVLPGMAVGGTGIMGKRFKSVQSASRRRVLVESPGSLVPDTVAEMAADPEFQLTAKALRELGAKKMALKEKRDRRRALDKIGVPSFHDFLEQRNLPQLHKGPIESFQINIGLTCNQACTHCHVESSPHRKETVDRATAEKLIQVLAASPSVKELDITGGAPEMHDQFRFIVKEARALGISVIDRCNLTVLYEPGQEDLPEFLADNGVRIAASLPCYSQENVNKQRGRGVFERSIQALMDLNDKGYGRPGTGLVLDLVYNPGGGFLPPSQAELEQSYKAELMEHFGIEFSNLFTMTNMPIKRFADFLNRRKQLAEYMALLVDNFNDSTVPNTMCNSLVSMRWDGALFDCDFNLTLDNPIDSSQGKLPSNIFDIDSVEDLVGRRVAVDNHCYGCTAGQGSS